MHQAYIARLKAENHLYHDAFSNDRIKLIIYNLKPELEELRQKWEKWLKTDAEFKTLADTLQEYDEARRLALRLTAVDPSNTEWQRDLSVSYERLGDVAAAQGKLDDAARAYRDGLAIRNTLAASDPGNTEWQRDLFVSSYQISKLQAQQKRWPDAIVNAEACFKIAERLSQLDPTNATWQEDVKASRAWLDKLKHKQAPNTH